MTSAGQAGKRYGARVTILMTLYVVLLILANVLFDRGYAEGAIAWAVALLPTLPIIGVFVAIGRLLVELNDEYVRMLMTRQMLVATGFMLSIATAWGFFESVDLVPHVEAYYAAVLWFAGLGVGGCANAWLERDGRGHE